MPHRSRGYRGFSASQLTREALTVLEAARDGVLPKPAAARAATLLTAAANLLHSQVLEVADAECALADFRRCCALLEEADAELATVKP